MFKYQGRFSYNSGDFHIIEDCQALVTPCSLMLWSSMGTTARGRSPQPLCRPSPPPKVKVPAGGVPARHATPALAPEKAEPGMAIIT